jgi:hypothetical protein
VTYELAVEATGGRESLYSRTLDPTYVFADRGWFEVDVSLEAYSGREVTLEFSTASDRESGERLEAGGWAEPRIVSASDPRSERR